MDLDTVAKIVSVVRDVVTTLAVFIGAAWAFYRFVLKRETAWNLVIEATQTFHSYERDLALLEVVFGAGHGEEIWIYKVWRTPTFATDGSGPVVAPVNGASKINS